MSISDRLRENLEFLCEVKLSNQCICWDWANRPLAMAQRTISAQINRIFFGVKSVTPNVATYRGVFAILSNGQEDLNNIDLTNRGLNKEIWLTLDDGKDSEAQCWVETGQTRATILNDSPVANDPNSPVTYNPQYKSHSGHFVGVAYVNTTALQRISRHSNWHSKSNW